MKAVNISPAASTNIRRAEIADIPELIELAHKIWHAHYPGIISVEQVEYMLADRYTPERLQKLIEDTYSLYLVAEDARGGKIQAFCFITNKPPHGAFFDQCYVDTDLHGSGIGTMFMKAAENFARNSGKLSLQVNRCNIKAINFYFRHGFKIERTNELDIGGGYFMNDFIMVRPLSKAGEL